MENNSDIMDKYIAEQESLKTHAAPAWFEDAKFGVIVGWGIYSIPAFAPTGKTSNEIISNEGWQQYFINTPYAEWYSNSIKIPGSPAAIYHESHYGRDFDYDDFAPRFKQHIKEWDPGKWADFFEKIGTRYVVYWAKFHDGFLMWPSKYKCPVKKDWYSERDTAGELAGAVRAKKIRMGIYYSGALDWAFTDKPVKDLVDLMTGGPATSEYGNYVDSHYRELIDSIAPDILWNDIAYPPAGNREQIIAHYYNTVPEGCINDRWVKYDARMSILKMQPARALVNWMGKRVMKAGKTGMPSNIHYDFSTPEFTTFNTVQQKKFESILSFGTSVAYNAQEKDSDYHSVKQMICWFCDIISKNGNLLLVVSPKADGSIPKIQSCRMLEFGRWIKNNSEAIFGSRPYSVSQGTTGDGTELRYTVNNNSLYVFMLSDASSKEIMIKGINPASNAEISLLGIGRKLKWQNKSDGVQIQIADLMNKKARINGSASSISSLGPVPVFKISPMP